jgi:hypothetical protein
MSEERPNGIVKKIDAVLLDPDTPRWGIVILLCLRDDHTRLSEHLAEHSRWSAPARQILVSVLTAIAVAGATWLLAARFG